MPPVSVHNQENGFPLRVPNINDASQWNCDDFDTSGERLVGELVSDGTGDKLDERLDEELDGDEHSDSSRLLLDAFSLSQSTSLMMIMLDGAGVISTSSSELASDDLMLLLSSLDVILSVNLFLLKRFLRFRHGSVRGNGGCWLVDF